MDLLLECTLCALISAKGLATIFCHLLQTFGTEKKAQVDIHSNIEMGQMLVLFFFFPEEPIIVVSDFIVTATYWHLPEV